MVVPALSSVVTASPSAPAAPDPLLRRIADHLGTLTGGDGWVVRVDEATGTWTVLAGPDAEGVAVPGSVVEELVATCDPVLVDAPGGPGVLAVPVRRGPRVVGACVVTAGRGGFSPPTCTSPSCSPTTPPSRSPTEACSPGAPSSRPCARSSRGSRPGARRAPTS